MKQLTFSILALSALVAGGCSEQSDTALEPDRALFAKPGSGGSGTVTSECGGSTALLDSRARLDWSAADAISGDGGGDIYTGGSDGVHAKIFYHDSGCSRSGDLVFDADMNSRKFKRHMTFHFPKGNSLGLGIERGAPFVNFRGIQFLGSDVNDDEATTSGRDAKIEEKTAGAPRGLEHPSETALRPDYPNYNGNTPALKFRFGATGISGCEALEYESIELKRTSSKDGFQPIGKVSGFDGLALGQWSHTEHLGTWVIRSVAADDGSHWAQCLVTKNGTLQPVGELMNMPFTVSITEER